MDDGNGGTLTEIDSATVRGNPIKLTHTVEAPTLPASSVGKTFMFKLLVVTEGGETESEVIGYRLASVPATPTSAPASDASVTSNKVIKVDVTPLTDDGGSPIRSYSIEVDDGKEGSYTALYGTQVDSLSTTYTLHSVTEGNTYRFRYRVKNEIGWSSYSPVGYIKAIAPPEAPLAPKFLSATESKISLGINFSTENNGGLIKYHELYRDLGDSGANFVQVTSYDGSSSAFDLKTALDPGLVSGKIYQFKVRAVSEAAQPGAFSDTISIALARLPEKLVAPTRVSSLSTQTRIAIAWTPLPNRDSPGGNVSGFRVYMAEGSGGLFKQVFRTNSASTTSYTATGLTPGRLYRFKVSAVNYNGEGPQSDITQLYACEDVQGIYAPKYVSATETTMVVSWQEPSFNGACPVTSYALFIDDGASGTPNVEVNTANDPNIRNKPSLRQATITSLTAGDLGKDYSLQLQVQTEMGTYKSNIVTIRFATVPPKPSSAPVEASPLSSTQVSVSYSSTLTGGSPILGYHLQYGVGLSGGFSDLIAADSNSMATAYTLDNVTKGQTYYFRFRVKNMYGWGPFSDIGFAVASERPAQANPPRISSFSATQIVLDLDQSVNNMGAEISEYVLSWATGTSPTTFTQIASYDGSSSTFTLPSGTDTITAGAIYHFTYAARNNRGLGEESHSTSVAATSLLPAPTGLKRVDTASSGSKITVTWDPSTPVNVPGDNILGYRFYVLDSVTSQYVKVFDGVENLSPTQTTFSYTSVQQGKEYTFKVSVVTFNGESSLSAAFKTFACSAPSGMLAPIAKEVTLSYITIGWSAPNDSGG